MEANPDSFVGFSPIKSPESATEEIPDVRLDESTRRVIEQTIEISFEHRTAEELMYFANGYEAAARKKRQRELEGRSG